MSWKKVSAEEARLTKMWIKKDGKTAPEVARLLHRTPPCVHRLVKNKLVGKKPLGPWGPWALEALPFEPRSLLLLGGEHLLDLTNHGVHLAASSEQKVGARGKAHIHTAWSSGSATAEHERCRVLETAARLIVKLSTGRGGNDILQTLS